MTDRYCVLIPHYRHDRQLAEFLPRLAAVGLPVVVVDDGSDAETRRRLRDLVTARPWSSLIERKDNGGKGAAMVTGMRYLWSKGFTHAISVDADGQHDPGDIAKLLRSSQREPGRLFSGMPVFGADIPAVRRHGRTITNLLARAAAGTSTIEDAMCGLRLYPLAKVLPLCRLLGSRQRMEFDIEILVRAYWAGLMPTFLPTRVVYPQGGRSHFRLVADNVRLARMHTTLLAEALLRLPRRRRSSHGCSA